MQAMLNDKHDSLFFGDIRQFHPSSCTFAAFLASAQQGDLSDKVHVHQQQHNRDSQMQAYLAQASLDRGQPLHALQQDISMPEVISHADVSHTNLWMNFRCLVTTAPLLTCTYKSALCSV